MRANLLMAPAFIDDDEGSASGAAPHRGARALEAGLPVPALSSALAYFDSYRQGRGTANLIQAQRDFFGAHGFERIDGKGAHPRPMGQRPRLSAWSRSAPAAASDQAPAIVLRSRLERLTSAVRLAEALSVADRAVDPRQHGRRQFARRPGGRPR